MDTPVALIIFNRPDTTAAVFQAIAAARPQRLFVIADGPRPDRPDDVARCAVTRAATEQVDWPCEVTRIYRDSNLGCGPGPASGISAVFEQVEECIILEDDCLPEPSFFAYCAELLARYRDDERVMMVSGNNFLLDKHQVAESYYFNHYAGMWGWATWRRAWRHHNLTISSWPALRDTSWLLDILMTQPAADYWARVFETIYAAGGTQDIWDAQWYYAMWIQRGLAVSPRTNLVRNIGFRADATHTRGNNPLGNLATSAIAGPLTHPSYIIRDRIADQITITHSLPQIKPAESRLRRIGRSIATALPRPLRTALVVLWHLAETGRFV